MNQWFPAFAHYKRRYHVYYLTAPDLTPTAHEWAMTLTTLNMKRMYQRAECGWDEKEKRAELSHPDARYFIITDSGGDGTEDEEELTQMQPNGTAEAASTSASTPSSTDSIGAAAAALIPSSDSSSPPTLIGSPVGFCHIRFERGDMDKAPVMYLYEIQVESDSQRHGLGRFLMALPSLLCISSHPVCMLLLCH